MTNLTHYEKCQKRSVDRKDRIANQSAVTNIMATFLKIKRIEAGLKQVELVAKLDYKISKASICTYELGEAEIPKDRLHLLLQFYKSSWAELGKYIDEKLKNVH